MHTQCVYECWMYKQLRNKKMGIFSKEKFSNFFQNALSFCESVGDIQFLSLITCTPCVIL